MRKTIFIAILSISLNIALASWLVNNYYYDQFFRDYVNAAFSRYYAYIVISIGLCGGLFLGYLFLRRRNGEILGSLKLERARQQKPTSMPVLSRAIEQAARPSSSTQTTKHTAYAVPPPLKSPPPIAQSAPPPSSFGLKSSMPGGVQAPDNAREKSLPSYSAPAQEGPPKPSSQGSTVRFEPNLPPVFRQPPPPSSRPSPSPPWRPEPRPGIDSRTDSRNSFPQSSEPGIKSGPQQWSPPAGVQSKWQPPESGIRPVQRNDPIPSQGYSPKWVPPPGQTSRPPETGSQRTGNLSPQRPPFGQTQPPPRPLAFPRPPRPLEPPGAPRPRPIMSGARPPPLTPPRPPFQSSVTTTIGGISSPSGPPSDKKQPSTGQPEKPSEKTSDTPLSESGPSSKIPTGTDNLPSGELDWDTALDTILKTLKKDKVETK